MATLIFYKPFDVLCQFSRAETETGKTLADFVNVSDVYPAGRLDRDSEGLVLLTDDGALQHRLTDPHWAHPRTYWVQVEGEITVDALGRLNKGVTIQGTMTRQAVSRAMKAPDLPERNPPIRFRKLIPTSWLELTLTEGRNRQVRRMTAVVGFPTLRLIRSGLGELTLSGLRPGQWRTITASELDGLQRFTGLAGASADTRLNAPGARFSRNRSR
jgi:23S rRNA pseudouridine2457 synthase